jgi:hypothetical protein|tara:strand:+ start:10486 stop:10722 length:237 start_codon:yes stop_codon:yes gene_type:complete
MPENQIKVNTPKEFSLMIEKLSKEWNMGIMDTVLEYCERNDMEVDLAAKLLNTQIKAKLQLEAEDLNFLPKSARLPVD